ncbi:MAG: nucleoside permease [Chitinophagaceae bacterium]
MHIKYRLILANFLEFFVWGTWLISMGGYMAVTLHATGGQIGAAYGTMGIASLFMPTIMGIIADRWLNAEKLLGICHLVCAALLLAASYAKTPNELYWFILLNCFFYMPTLALNNSVAYTILQQRGMDVVKDFPPIRVWGTVGFIVAMWAIDLFGWTVSPMQFIAASIVSAFMGLYCFTLPHCPPVRVSEKKNWVTTLGLEAFVLFKRRKMAVFFLFSLLLGAALQITNAFGEPFLHDFDKIPAYSGSFAVKHPSILISLSQMSETLFILTIPFFLRKFGIKNVMLMSMVAWVFRFGLFGIGNPGSGLVFLVLSMVVYGMAFDFFNISGSLFVEEQTDKSIRASAQGLFMLMTNGIGAYMGGIGSGLVVDYFTDALGIKDWHSIWLTFAAYALVIGVAFAFMFQYKHGSEKEGKVVHP